MPIAHGLGCCELKLARSFQKVLVEGVRASMPRDAIIALAESCSVNTFAYHPTLIKRPHIERLFTAVSSHGSCEFYEKLSDSCFSIVYVVAAAPMTQPHLQAVWQA
jgi:hypothetical protein